MAPLTTLGVGGPAQWYADLHDPDDVREAWRWASDRGLPLTVLGGGSNVIVHDAGVPGLVARVGLKGRHLRWNGDRLEIEAGAGEEWDALVAAATAEGAWGLEGLSGIPGTVGGTPIQNVGAYGQDVSQTLTSVTALDRQTGEVVTLDGAACGFGYRESGFRGIHRDRYIIASVTFRLDRSRRHALYAEVERALGPGRDDVSPAAVRDAVVRLRRAKGMVVEPGNPDSRSVGSFFVNPVLARSQLEGLARVAGVAPPEFPADDGRVKVPAAWLIERTGWSRGDGRGSVGLSSRHTLAIINRGGATAEAVVALAVEIKRAVLEKFGVVLSAEPNFLGFGEDARVAFLKGVEI